ncbi:meiosis-specific protein MEI4 [Paramisgurnus dabryanus]|uniref:meiosis-specific protein MEI4 n=1 Tax=Paramisgurnus dabryanus TaxID=90735 RepID=UPI0031F424BD
MEKKSTSCHDGAVSWYVQVCRLAVAVAIIKTKPSEGVRQFTQSLAKTLKQQDEGWKSKACDLHKDVLRLRQELLISRLLLKAGSRATGAGTPNGQEVVEVLTHNDAQQSKSDSGCETDMSSHNAEGPSLPLTPPNSQNFLLQGSKWRQDCGLVKHMQFLQCLSGLRRDYKSALCVDDDDLVWDSVVQLLDCVLDVFRRAHFGQPVHHPELLRHATQVVAQTLSRGKIDQRPSVQHFSRVEDLLKEMICLLLTSHQINEFSVKVLLSECLIALGKSRVMRVALVQFLMAQIVQLSQHLWDICQRSTDHLVDWIRYENSFYVFWVLEQLSADAHNDVSLEVMTQLENRAFCLSDEFPLFSLYMWRIGGLFRSGRPQEHAQARSPSFPVGQNFPEAYLTGNL